MFPLVAMITPILPRPQFMPGSSFDRRQQFPLSAVPKFRSVAVPIQYTAAPPLSAGNGPSPIYGHGQASYISMHWQAASIAMCTARPFIWGIGDLPSTHVFIGAYNGKKIVFIQIRMSCNDGDEL